MFVNRCFSCLSSSIIYETFACFIMTASAILSIKVDIKCQSVLDIIHYLIYKDKAKQTAIVLLLEQKKNINV